MAHLLRYVKIFGQKFDYGCITIWTVTHISPHPSTFHHIDIYSVRSIWDYDGYKIALRSHRLDSKGV